MPDQQLNQLASHLFRHESGRMTAVLTRMLGLQRADLAEDIVQETLLQALHTWKIKGIPDNPTAWLYTVAKRKAIDAIRTKQLHLEIESGLVEAFRSEWTIAPAVQQFFFEHEIEDSQLRMMFVCCHPSITYESQLALTLKTLCGLSISEIAHCFLTNEETITKRLYRARETIRNENIVLEIPSPATVTSRMDAVLQTIYLLFNEGYNSTSTETLIRHDLCAEAMRLNLLLTSKSLTNLPKTHALLALLCFQASRINSRTAEDGSIILLQDQDRSLWDATLIEKGKAYLNSAAEGDEFTEYHFEAAIAACHAQASSFETTDWKSIIYIYDLLSTIKDDPIVEMNKAIAISFSGNPEQALRNLKEIRGLDKNSIFHGAIGDVYMQLKNTVLAKEHYEQAMILTKSKQEKDLLRFKMA
jgi:RNA polymerase sigma factor (sigma-70 family)